MCVYACVYVYIATSNEKRGYEVERDQEMAHG